MGNPEKVKRTAPKSAGGTAEGRFRSKNDSHSIANQRSSDNIFQTIKNKITTREAAEFYGLKVGRNGMACCPFHPDRNPSLKVDERFHCFGCGADGDVIDYAAKLFHLTNIEAARKLAGEILKFTYQKKHFGQYDSRRQSKDRQIAESMRNSKGGGPGRSVS